MNKDILIPLILMVAQIPISIWSATMPKTQSRVPPITSAIAALLIFALTALYWADKVSGDWAFYGAIGVTAVSIVIAAFYVFRNSYIARKVVGGIEQAIVHARRNQAQVIHSKIDGLTTELWRTKDKLLGVEDLQQNPEIKRIMDELQSELNNLGHLVNNHDFDRFAEALMLEYSRFLKFHYDVHHDWGEWGRARINSKLRWYINHKVKG